MERSISGFRVKSFPQSAEAVLEVSLAVPAPQSVNVFPPVGSASYNPQKLIQTFAFNLCSYELESSLASCCLHTWTGSGQLVFWDVQLVSNSRKPLGAHPFGPLIYSKAHTH